VLAAVAATLEAHDVSAARLEGVPEPTQPELELWSALGAEIELLSNRECI
jgi:hypothetical protein